MSIGPLSHVTASAAGSPLAQTKGDADQAKHAADVQQRQTAVDQRAKSAAGIGETDGEDHETEERDADGRRVLEIPSREKKQGEDNQDRGSKDATGDLGRVLDLSG
ncbi:MAG: hypothetical protein ACUVQG_11445 [Thermogutta sp.]